MSNKRVPPSLKFERIRKKLDALRRTDEAEERLPIPQQLALAKRRERSAAMRFARLVLRPPPAPGDLRAHHDLQMARARAIMTTFHRMELEDQASSAKPSNESKKEPHHDK